MSPSGHLTAKTQYAHCWSPNCVPARLEGNKSHHDRGCCSCCCCCCPFSQWLITALRAWHVTRWTLSVSFCLSLSLSLNLCSTAVSLSLPTHLTGHCAVLQCLQSMQNTCKWNSSLDEHRIRQCAAVAVTLFSPTVGWCQCRAFCRSSSPATTSSSSF